MKEKRKHLEAFVLLHSSASFSAAMSETCLFQASRAASTESRTSVSSGLVMPLLGMQHSWGLSSATEVYCQKSAQVAPSFYVFSY